MIEGSQVSVRVHCGNKSLVKAELIIGKARYPLEPAVRDAIAKHDVPFLAARTNPYLLRYYFFATGMKDDEFIKRLNG